jgi:hypothetical protein
MKFIFNLVVLILILIVSSSLSFKHKYFFGFAEIEYKQESKTIETTLIFTAHDLELHLKKNNIIEKEFEFVAHDSIQLKKIEQELIKDFYIISENKVIQLSLLDFELSKNGLIHLFFIANDAQLSNEIEIVFSSLMNVFPQQQNKITFINKGVKKTAVFLKNKPRQKISII